MLSANYPRLDFSSPPGDPFQPGSSGGQSNPFDPSSLTDDSGAGYPDQIDGTFDIDRQNPSNPLFPLLDI